VKEQILSPLTSLRFMAAFMVLCHHYFGFKEGYVGVTFFFVLSGFILTYKYHDANFVRQNRREFWIRRIARIYPMHILTLFASIPLVFSMNFFNSGAIDMLISISPKFILNVLLLQSYIPSNKVYFSYNAVSWSISTEAFFYFVFPLLMGFFAIRSTKKIAKLMSFVVLFLILFAVFWATFYPAKSIFEQRTHYIFYINPFTRCVEFALGMLIGLHFVRGGKSIQSGTLLECFALAFAAATLWLVSANVVPPALNLSLVAVPASMLVVAVFARGAGAISRLFSLPGLVLLGEASYALYMIHVLVGRYLTLALGRSFSTFVIATVVTLVLSIILYLSFEKPMQRWVLSLGSRRGDRTASQRG